MSLKIKKLLIFLLVTVLLIFAITACKTNDDINDNPPEDSEQGQEAGGGRIYEIVEESVTIGESTEWALPGILSLPKDADAPVPVVVLVHGSGANSLSNYTAFKDIADYLPTQGIAVLRYEKRTVVHGTKMDNVNLTIHDETIEDAILASELLKNDSRIDSSQVYLLGHSLGGMVAPRIDAEGGDFAGIIIWSGTPRSLIEVFHNQMLRYGIDQYPEEQRATAREQINQILQASYMLKDVSNEVAKTWNLGIGYGYYCKDFQEYPSNEYLQKTEKPILIMQGGNDFQVLADVDFVAYKELLEGKDNVTFKLYPDLSHSFIKSTPGTPGIYVDQEVLEDSVSTEVLQDIIDWLKAN